MLVTKEFANELLRYGEILTDQQYRGINEDSYHRLRIIKANGCLYLHIMKNGTITHCELIGKEK